MLSQLYFAPISRIDMNSSISFKLNNYFYGYGPFTNNLAAANLKEYLFSGFRQNFPVGEFRSMEVSRFDEEG